MVNNMPLFKKSIDKLRKENIEYLQKLTQTCDLCLRYSENTEHNFQVEAICDEVRYFIPYQKEDVQTIDKKIKNNLDDLKILIHTNRDPLRVTNKIKDLQILIKERSAKE